MGYAFSDFKAIEDQLNSVPGDRDIPEELVKGCWQERRKFISELVAKSDRQSTLTKLQILLDKSHAHEMFNDSREDGQDDYALLKSAIADLSGNTTLRDSAADEPAFKIAGQASQADPVVVLYDKYKEKEKQLQEMDEILDTALKALPKEAQLFWITVEAKTYAQLEAPDGSITLTPSGTGKFDERGLNNLIAMIKGKKNRINQDVSEYLAYLETLLKQGQEALDNAKRLREELGYDKVNNQHTKLEKELGHIARLFENTLPTSIEGYRIKLHHALNMYDVTDEHGGYNQDFKQIFDDGSLIMRVLGDLDALVALDQMQAYAGMVDQTASPLKSALDKYLEVGKQTKAPENKTDKELDRISEEQGHMVDEMNTHPELTTIYEKLELLLHRTETANPFEPLPLEDQRDLDLLRTIVKEMKPQ